jgi:hypothetical protein
MNAGNNFIKFDNGLYLGEISEDGLRQGHGIMLYNDDSFYQGNWELDLKQGIGHEKVFSGSYFGEFQNGLRQGKGTYWNNLTKEVYSGDWHKGCKHGHGLLSDRKGNEFEGFWERDLRHGFGITRKKGVCYQGLYRDGMKHGMFCFFRFAENKSFKVKFKFGRKVGVVTKKGYTKIKNNNLIEIQMKRNKDKLKKRNSKTLNTRSTSHLKEDTLEEIDYFVPEHFVDTTKKHKKSISKGSFLRNVKIEFKNTHKVKQIKNKKNLVLTSSQVTSKNIQLKK